jgi:hypothetical protein
MIELTMLESTQHLHLAPRPALALAIAAMVLTGMAPTAHAQANLCLPNTSVSGNLTHQATNSITAPCTSGGSYVVGAGAAVTFQAGSQIVLLPGFHAAPGSSFYALIAPPVLPAITSLTPSSGLAGTSGVVIAGTNFGTLPGTVTFQGAAVAANWGPSAITFQVPSTIGPGTYSVVVITADGFASSPGSFVVTQPPAPAISSLTPTSGAAGTTSVVVSGSSFGTAVGTLTFAGSAIPTTNWSSGSITFLVPAGATVGANAVVVTANGQSSAPATFTVLAPPSITSVSPLTGAAGTQVTITGSNFGTATGAVSFGSTPATSIVSWTPTQIVVTAPVGLSSGVSVSVTVSGFPPVTGSSSFVETYSVSGTVNVTSNNATAPLAGVTVTLSQAGATVGSPVTTAATGAYAFPAQPPGTYQVTPSLTGYLFQAATINLTANQTAVNFQPSAPAISGLSLSSGPSQMGFQIQGAGFGPTATYTTVSFNGQAVIPILWVAGPNGGTDGTNITIQVPPNAALQASAIVVTVGTAPSNSVNFQVTAPFGCN